MPQLLVGRAALEEARDRLQLDGGEGDEVVRPDEDVELAGVQPTDVRVVDGEVEDGEEVVGVFVDLRPLPLRENVLEVERVPAKTLGEQRRLLERRGVQVNPGQPMGVELCVARLRPCVDVPRLRAGSRALDAGQARHRD